MFDFQVLRECFIFYNDSSDIEDKSTDTASHLVEVYLHLLFLQHQIVASGQLYGPVTSSPGDRGAHWVVRVGPGTVLDTGER
jgi:hypothetical protein